jgi:hypothetical protein
VLVHELIVGMSLDIFKPVFHIQIMARETGKRSGAQSSVKMLQFVFDAMIRYWRIVRSIHGVLFSLRGFLFRKARSFYCEESGVPALLTVR